MNGNGVFFCAVDPEMRPRLVDCAPAVDVMLLSGNATIMRRKKGKLVKSCVSLCIGARTYLVSVSPAPPSPVLAFVFIANGLNLKPGTDTWHQVSTTTSYSTTWCYNKIH